MIQFFEADIKFHVEHKQKLKNWLKKVAQKHSCTIQSLEYIFCSDEYLLTINKEHLQHDDYTDIITFQYHTNPHPIEGEIYISVDRVKENAQQFNVAFDQECRRVMAHGLLHLCGFGDKSVDEKREMRSKEDEALQMFHVEQ